MSFQSNLLYHSRAVQQCVNALRGQARVDMETFVLRIEANNRYFDLQPQFLCETAGMKYSPTMPPQGLTGFVGWLPYFNKRWPEAFDKLAFKEYCDSRQIRVPAYGTDRFDKNLPYLIKKRTGSLGAGVRGPFRSEREAGRSEPLRQGEFREAFLDGTIAKAGYWNDRLVFLELSEQARVATDGKTSLRQLCLSQAGIYANYVNWEHVEATLAYQGVTADAVPPAGKSFLVDCRYQSPVLALSPTRNFNVLSGKLGTPDPKVVERFTTMGAAFWKGIPAGVRQGTYFSVDAIVERDGQVSFLEMNCNPMVHPDVYLPMLSDLLGVRAASPESASDVPEQGVPSEAQPAFA